MAVHSKKPKSQGMEIMADKEKDRISGLPDKVLSRILSFLELREAVKTSVLSKRWEKVWTSIHRIRLDNKSCIPSFYDDFVEVELSMKDMKDLFDKDYYMKEQHKRRTNFINFVNGVLTGNNKLSVTSFSLSYAFGSTIPREIQYVTEWIAAVVTPELRKVDFLISYGFGYSISSPPIKLPPTLFECQNLVILRLNCTDWDRNICLDVPKTVCLPRLEKLHLASVQLDDENSLKNVLSGCPVLEELEMDRIKLLHKHNKSQNLFVFSPSLKILRVLMNGEVTFSCFRCYVVEAPKLEYLDFVEYSLLGFSMSCSPSLVSAKIHISTGPLSGPETSIRNPSPLSGVELFQGISNVQKLELSTNDIVISDVEHANLPEFSNLIHLKLGDCSRNRHVVNCILQKSPNLKHLVFSDDHVDSPSFMWRWSQPDSVPKCLVLHLETIELTFRLNIEDAMKIIEYCLDKGKVLKKMAITTPFSRDKDLNSRLLGFPRASVGCEIVVSKLNEDISDYSDYSD